MPLYSARIAATVRYTADSTEAAREVVDLMQITVSTDPRGKVPAGFEAHSLSSVVDQVSVSEVPHEDPGPI
jgi:hypothetical protein